jgi:CheY-like chemotaxis protein
VSGTALKAPRVVLVEDDDSVRRYVAMALEDFDVDLVACPDVSQALRALHEAPAALVISDLMMPGDSGFVLLERLAQDPALKAGARVAVFSAGVTASVREQLQALGVWRILPKPIALAALQACVQDALSSGTGAPAEAPALQGDVVAEHFGGDAALFASYRAMCLLQFPVDVKAGDDAAARLDNQALRRLAHSLKTVLRTLGHPGPGETAQAIEQSVESGALEDAWREWPRLRAAILELHSRQAG